MAAKPGHLHWYLPINHDRDMRIPNKGYLVEPLGAQLRIERLSNIEVVKCGDSEFKIKRVERDH